MSRKNLSAINRIPKILRAKLRNKKINKIYKNFEKSLKIDEAFAVAVSGGPDSLALSFLSKIYSSKKKLLVKYYIVDHKLRNESTKEARKVKKILKKNSIHSQILTWNGKKPHTNIQSLARFKRYELILDKCNKHNISNLLLAHQEDDLVENFFIRILRGSGLKGLVSLDKISKFGNKTLLRPLIDQKKEDLVFLSKYVFDFYVEDPSNKNEKFKRIKVRKLIGELRENGLDTKKLVNTIKNLKSSNDVVNFYVDENFTKNTFFSTKKNELTLNRDFFSQPYEIIFRSFSKSIKLVGKKYYSARGKKIDKMIKNIMNNTVLRATLGGCIIKKVNQTVIISKEL